MCFYHMTNNINNTALQEDRRERFNDGSLMREQHNKERPHPTNSICDEADWVTPNKDYLGQPPDHNQLYYYCNELGGGRRQLYSDATDVGLSGSHQDTPVMVYDDLMIRNNTVLGYNTNRSRPVTVQ